MRHATFVERFEAVLTGAMALGIVLIAQRYSLDVYQWGLGLLVGATLLQIAVGNTSKTASPGRAILTIVLLLAVVAAVFVVGIWLVPILSQLGR